MKELGVWGRNRYPACSIGLGAFHDLGRDLEFATDFLTGEATILRSAARKEAAATSRHGEERMASYVGDTDALRRKNLHTNPAFKYPGAPDNK